MYGFAGGDPVNYQDPFGLAPQWWDEFKTGLRQKFVRTVLRVLAAFEDEEVSFDPPEPVPVVQPGPTTPKKDSLPQQPPPPTPSPSVNAPPIGVLITVPLIKLWSDQFDWMRSLPGRLRSLPLPAPIVPLPLPVPVPIPE